MANTSILTAFERMWQHVVAANSGKSDINHTHDDMYYTEAEMDSKLDTVNASISNITSGSVSVAKADEAVRAISADEAVHATSADNANVANSATKATQDASGNVITDTYETKADSQTKLDSAKSYTDSKVSGLASTSTVDTKISTHNTSTSAHNDIRDLISGLTTRLNTLADSDDTTLDQMSEIVEYIKNNKSLIDSVTTTKVNVSDIVDNLTTNVANKPLSAAQGVAIKSLIDALQLEVDGKADSDHTHNYAGSSSAGGSANSAVKWETARNINGMSVDGSANRTNYGSCSTAAGTAAKTVDCTGFSLVTGAEITVKFTVSNAAANPTLNVNSTGAKPIFYRGAAIDKAYLVANRTYTFRYDGTNWDFVGDINVDTNTDTKVTQTNTTSDGDYRVLFSGTADDTSRAESARKSTNLKYNPSTGTLSATELSGSLNVSNLVGSVPVAKGGTGSTTAAGALTNLGLTATAAELNYMDGVTSNVQTQINTINSSLNKYVKAYEYLTEPLLDRALTLSTGIWFFQMGGTSYTGTDLPCNAYKPVTVYVRSSNSISVVIHDTNRLYLNYYNGSEWDGWSTLANTDDLAKYLPLTGGTLTNNLTVKRAGSVSVDIYAENDLRKASFGLATDGRAGIYDFTNDKWMLCSDTTGTNVNIPAHLSAGGITSDGYIYQNSFDNQLIMGAQNETYCHFTSSKRPFYFDKDIYVNGDKLGKEVHSHNCLKGYVASTTNPSSTAHGELMYGYNLNSDKCGVLPKTNNANGVMTINTHSGNYYHQFGFSSNNNLYHRAVCGVALSDSISWGKVLKASDFTVTGSASSATLTINLD